MTTEIVSLREARKRAERAAVDAAMKATGNNISRAARLLGVSRPTLYDLLHKLGYNAVHWSPPR